MGGELSTFNTKDGYAESLVRGNKLALLTPDDYRKLAMAENLEDLRSCLEDTDYGAFLQDEPLPIGVQTVHRKCREKFAAEFRALQGHAYQPLGKFLDYVIAEKIIDMVVSIIQGVLNEKAPEEIIAQADPLVWTPDMKALLALDATSGFDELYRTVLVDTPVGRYFEDYLEQRTAAKQEAGGHGGGQGNDDVADIFSDIDLEVMRASLKKCWLEDFYAFTQKLGGTTAETMHEILMRQADFLTLSITLNTLASGSGDGEGNGGVGDRITLYPCFGHLYPAGIEALRRASTDAQIRYALDGYPEYLSLYEQCREYYLPDGGEDVPIVAGGRAGGGREDGGNAGAHGKAAQMSLEDVIYRQEVVSYEMAYERQMHYGVFYAWAKLKEQEIRNILWIADMILMQRRDHMDQVLPLFQPRI